MLCRTCSAIQPPARPLDFGGPTVGAATEVLCASCGAVLGPEDMAARLLAKLAQLQGCGLGGAGLLRTLRSDPRGT